MSGVKLEAKTTTRHFHMDYFISYNFFLTLTKKNSNNKDIFAVFI